jgi:V8-like Glu-specific endopeptidase
VVHGILAKWRKASLGLFLASISSAGYCTTAAESGSHVSAAPSSIGAPDPMASVYGTDNRKPVGGTTQFPWSAIGLVEVQVGWETYVGTGVMIGKSLALTCGHVVSGPETRNATSITFIPGQNGGEEPFGRINVVKVIPTSQWAASAADGYDIAILVLESSIGDSTGWFQIAVKPDAFFADAILTTAGYPTDMGTFNPYSVSGRSYGMDGNIIIHDLDSEPGQSGSPVWYGSNDGGARLVGLLEGSYITSSPFGTGQEGIAARIDSTTANWIEEELAAYGDVPQGIAGSTVTPTTDPSPNFDTSMCGLGSTQALFGGALAYSACLVSRRRRWI